MRWAHRGQAPHIWGDPGSGAALGHMHASVGKSGPGPLVGRSLPARPLIPVVLPQANLPLLQRELLHCARLAKQNPAQYLAQHEQLLLDASTTSPVDSSELLLDVNENGKRRTPDR